MDELPMERGQSHNPTDVERESAFMRGRGWQVRINPNIGEEITAEGFDESGNPAVIAHVTQIQDNGIYVWYELLDNPEPVEENFTHLVDPPHKVLRDYG